MLNELAITAAGLVVCAIVLMTVKCTAPISPNEAEVIWTMHRKTTCCRGHKWKPIKHRHDKIVGFRCECGYKYTQKRPLVCRSLKPIAESSEPFTPFFLFDV